MKCPYCENRPNMEIKTDGNNNYWYECPQCHKTVGKKEESDQNNDR